MSDHDFRLADDFPGVPLSDWLETVKRDLKGAPYEKKLVTRTYEGLPIQPLYARKDWDAAGDPSGFPGLPPFTRGGTPLGAAATGWDIRQEYTQPTSSEVNAALRKDLAHGTASVLLRLDRAARAGLDPDRPEAADLAGRDGLMLSSADSMASALDGVDLHRVPVALMPGAGFVGAAALLADVWARWEITPDEARGAFNADPLGQLASGGRLPTSEEGALADLGGLAVWTHGKFPGVTSVLVDTAPYHDAGADAVQELALAMATGLAYLKAITAAGLDIDAAAGQIAFSFSVDADFFTGIAKLRAARRVWARLVQASGGGSDAQKMRLHARTSARMMTRRDPWVNILRTTVGAFAAGVAGVDALTVTPFDAAIGISDDFARRIARNVQVILLEESHLGKVIDPAGGGWFLEKRTDELALASWTLFQEIEDRCGLGKALRHGWVAERIGEVHAERLKNLATRRDPITGVSEFPNVDEEPVVRKAPDPASQRADASVSLGRTRERGAVADALEECRACDRSNNGNGFFDAAVRAAVAGAGLGAITAVATDEGEPAVIDPLPVHRFAESYEALRDAAEDFAERTGRRPLAFLANLGKVAQHTGRATWSRNFLEAGGFEVLTNKGFPDADAAAAAAAESGAPLAVICSADPVYADLAAPTAAALKKAGVRRILLAGRPGEFERQWCEAGVDGYIHLGCDVLATLRGLLQDQGVKA